MLRTALSMILIGMTAAAPLRALAGEIPAFTPNVVDPSGTLGTSDAAEINEVLAEIRRDADILGAVWIVDTLDGNSIEDLAVRAFKQWQLGTSTQDNGLLLVLAMKDRRSRFEVGYGLEGSLTDLVSRRALDEVLRPKMRKGEVKEAIIDSFRYLASVKSKDPNAERFVPQKPRWKVQANDELDITNGLAAYLVYLFCLWILAPLTRHIAKRLARRLAAAHPELGMKDNPVFTTKSFPLSALPILLFLTINPGCFIFLLSAKFDLVAAACLVLTLLIAFSYGHSTIGRYRSAESFQRYIERMRRLNKAMMEKGYVRETSPGSFVHTQAYYSSDEFAASRRSSSSSSSSSWSSSSSSSSGGGSSGGGGASSSW